MHQEITCATDFIVKLLCTSLPHPHKDSFRERLAEALQQHCSEHWFPERPHHGSAYRCIRSEGERCDPIVRRAAEKAGVVLTQLSFPQSFAVWIDPADVSARIGDRGSIFSLQEAGGSSSSNSSDAGSSPRASPVQQYQQAFTPSPQTSPIMSPRMPHSSSASSSSHHHHQYVGTVYQYHQQQPQYYPHHQQHHHHQQHQHQQQQQQSQPWSYNQRQPLVVYA